MIRRSQLLSVVFLLVLRSALLYPTSGDALPDITIHYNDPFDYEIPISSFTNDGDAAMILSVSNLPEWISEGDSSPSNSKIISTMFTPSATGGGLYLKDNFLYICDSRNLKIINVTDPYRAKILSSIFIMNSMTVHVYNDMAYVISLSGGLIGIDVSDKTKPTIVGTYQYGTGKVYYDVFVKDIYAYVAFGNGVLKVNVSSPDQYTFHSINMLAGAPVSKVVIYENFGLAMVKCPSCGTSAGLHKFNYLDMEETSEVVVQCMYGEEFGYDETGDLLLIPGCLNNGIQSFSLDPFVSHGSAFSEINILGVSIVGRYAFVLMDGEGFGVQILDYEQLDLPALRGSWMEIEDGSTANKLVVDDDEEYLYVSGREDGLFIFNVTDKNNVQVIRHFGFMQTMKDLNVVDDVAYFCDGDRGHVKLIDVSDPKDPFEMGIIWKVGTEFEDKCRASEVSEDASTLYVGSERALSVYDITDPYLPKRTGGYAVDCLHLDRYNFTLFCRTSLDGHVSAYDVSDPTLPVHDYYVEAMEESLSTKWFFVDRERGLLYVTYTDMTMSKFKCYEILKEGITYSEVIFEQEEQAWEFSYELVYCTSQLCYVETKPTSGDRQFRVFDVSDTADIHQIYTITVPSSFTIYGHWVAADDEGEFVFLGIGNFVKYVSNATKESPPVGGKFSDVLGYDLNGNVYGGDTKKNYVYFGTAHPSQPFMIAEFGGVTLTKNMSVALDESDCGDYPIIVRARDRTGDISQVFTLRVRGSSSYLDDYCSVYECNGVMTNTSEICGNGRGVCVFDTRGAENNNYCDCHEGFYGDNCTVYKCFDYFSNDTRNVCSGNGVCVLHNETATTNASAECSCKLDYSAHECDQWYCAGLPQDYKVLEHGGVCSGHGKCLKPDECSCLVDEYYFGAVCNETKCFGVWNNQTTSDVICASFGDCVYHDQCDCYEGYYGVEVCNITHCYGVMSNDSRVCGGHGTCDYHQKTCDCLPSHWDYSPNCDVTMCFGVFSNISIRDEDASQLGCGVHGKCVDLDQCDCHDNYYGRTCNITTCSSSFSNTSDSCGVHGACIDYDVCDCDDLYFLDEYLASLNNGQLICSITTCFGVYSNHTHETASQDASSTFDVFVCSGFGDCDVYDVCSCDDGYYGRHCNVTTCGGFWNNDTATLSKICKGRGVCEKHDNCKCDRVMMSYEDEKGNCECKDEYVGRYCNHTQCNGVWFNDTIHVCSGHGTCIIDDQSCECKNNSYSGGDCEYWYCGESRNDEKWVCSGHGDCNDINTCSCDSSKYTGSACEFWACWGVNVKSHSVCGGGGHGICIDQDVCLCVSGYSSRNNIHGNNCTEWSCGKYEKDDFNNACNGRGDCDSANMCSCRGNFEGDLCETWSCGYDHNHPNTCNGKGKCKNPGECECNGGWVGSNCQTNAGLIMILVPSSSLAGMVILSLVCCLLCCCCSIICLVGSVVFVMMLLSLVQSAKVSKYGKLKNFDVLLQEQALEDDISIAHLKMDKSNFGINFDEIKVGKMIGEGGSSSVVFRAKWQSLDIAFKCFKTRIVCSTQQKFDEFEREVEVLASVSHPNIVRFYGATIQKPRIGIVMEFCENGDLFQFLTSERFEGKDNSERYPLFKKIERLEEVVHAMDYLHSRNIIHRDLKLENVLLDEKENAKLMDFGLSKIVDRMSQKKTTRIGTNLYMSPEVLSQNIYTEKCDVFSFGIFIYIFLTEIWEPYGSGKEATHIEIKVSSDPLFRPNLYRFDEMIPRKCKWVRDAMIRCWNHDPDARNSFNELNKMFGSEMKKLKSSGYEEMDYISANQEDQEQQEEETPERRVLFAKKRSEEDEMEEIRRLEVQLKEIKTAYFDLKQKIDQ